MVSIVERGKICSYFRLLRNHFSFTANDAANEVVDEKRSKYQADCEMEDDFGPESSSQITDSKKLQYNPL